MPTPLIRDSSDSRSLLLIRHSIPEVDRSAPARDWPLSPEGFARCDALAEFLAREGVQHLATSRERKAVETTRRVAELLGIEYSEYPGLHEHQRVAVPWFPTAREFRQAVSAFFERPSELVFGEETAEAAHTRYRNAVEEVTRTWLWSGPVAITTHGTVLSLFAARLCGVNPLDIWSSLTLPCVVAIRESAKRRELEVVTWPFGQTRV